MVNVTDENRMDIIRSYSHELLDSMDWDSLYAFAYEQLVQNKDGMTNNDLEHEIRNYCPQILEN